MKLHTATLSLLGAASLVAATNVIAEDAGPTGPLDISNFSTSLWFTTEYMFRGISNSDGPAFQGSLDWTYNGFYVGAWGSNTIFSDSDIEIDYYGGYRFTFAGVGFDIGALYYSFPGEDGTVGDGLDPALPSDPNANYFEAQLVASKTFDLPWSPSVSAKYNYSPDFFGSDGSAHAVQGDVGVIAPLGFFGDTGFSASVGYQTVEGDETSGSQLGFLESDGVTVLDGYDYVWWRVGAYKDIGGFKVDISYFGTDESSDLEGVYPSLPDPSDFRDLIESHVVLTVSRSFTF